MKVVGVLASIFFMLVFIAFGLLLLLMVFGRVDTDHVIKATEYLIRDLNARLVTGIGGLLLILISYLPLRALVGNQRRERSIAFNNPDGQVQISLAAIEDFIRRLSYDLAGLKELKPKVNASRKGLEISNRVSFYSGASIPEAAAKMQSLIKNRVQEMLGIEEPIIVKIHVTKIVQKEKGKEKEESAEEPRIPYR